MPDQIHTVDIVVPRFRIGDPGRKFQVEMALVRRRREGTAFYGYLALPGGKLEENDYDLLQAARRELLEEVGLDIPECNFYQVGTYARLGRDPRPGRWISTLYVVAPLFPGQHIIEDGPQDKTECSLEWLTIEHAR